MITSNNLAINNINDDSRLRILGVQIAPEGLEISYTSKAMEGRVYRKVTVLGVDLHADIGEELDSAVSELVDTAREIIEHTHRREVAPPDVIYTDGSEFG